MELTLQKTDNKTFVLPYKQDQELSQKLKLGALFKAKITTAPRNILHHKKFFAILKTVVENCNDFPNTEVLLSYLKIRTGHCYIIKTKKETYQFPKSINFNKMNQEAFDTFYNKAMIVLSEYLGVSIGDLETNSLDNL